MTYRTASWPSSRLPSCAFVISRVGWRGYLAGASCALASLAGDLLGDGVGCVVVQLFDHALVGVAGQGSGGMAELLRDDLDVDAGRQSDRGSAVPQVMQ